MSVAVRSGERIPILIAGGGLGGLTTALALHRLGQPSRLVLREDSLTQSGGAVFLTKSALRILDRLGLGTCVRTIGVPVQRADVRSRSGAPLFAAAQDAYSGGEVYAAPRARLRHAFLAALPPGCAAFGVRLTGARAGARAVAVSLRDARGDAALAADRVIGADGGRSAVRSAIARPGASEPTNAVAFRALVRSHDLRRHPLHVAREAWDVAAARSGTAARFGACRVTPTDVFWWATLSVGAAPGKGERDAHERGIVLRPFRRKLAATFKDWPFSAEDLVSDTPEGAIERTELRRFRSESPWMDDTGRVLLVGDAARQCDIPYLHHGSSMAIEDGYALAMALDGQARTGGSSQPLERYVAERRARDESVQSLWVRFQSLIFARDPLSRFIARKSLELELAQLCLDSDDDHADGLERIKAMQFDVRGRPAVT